MTTLAPSIRQARPAKPARSALDQGRIGHGHRPGRLGRQAMLAATGLAVALAFAATSGRAVLRAPLTLAAGFADALAMSAGYGLVQVSISGNSHAPASELLGLVEREVGGTSTLSLSLPVLRARLERHPWVAAAHVALELPDHLVISIIERRPVAVWQHDGHFHLLDSEGRILGPAEPGLESLLARFEGAGAPAASGRLLALLAQTPAVARRMSAAARVGERRWTLALAGGVRVELPESGEREALLALEALLEAGFAAPVIDMRSGSRRAVLGPGDDRR